MDQGRWKPEYQARQDKLVALAQKRVAVFKAALDAASKQGLEANPSNEKWMAFWADFKQKNGVTESFGEDVQALE